MRAFQLHAALAAYLLLSASPSLAQPPLDLDVVVIGATPSGIAAGIAAASGVRARHAVHIFEALPMLGGMAVAGGVGLMNNEKGVYGQGLGGRWCALNGAAYGSQQPNCFPEMFVGEASFQRMLSNTTNLTLSLGCRLLAVSRSGACLTAATFQCADRPQQPLAVTARVFIDATYDGEAMVAAGVAHAHGREAASEFNESLAGVIEPNDPNESFGSLGIDPFWADGTLLPGISAEPLPPLGSADDRLMAFSFFLCASPLLEGRAIPWARPAGYNASDFELLRRVIARYGELNRTFELSDFTEWQAYATPPNRTKILMCCGRAPVNMDQPDLNRGWATATHDQRRAMEAAHLYYLLGSLYFMASDPSVNNYTRYAIGRWGLCADEYVATQNLPPQIYVRVSNRLRGLALLTQNNISAPQLKGDSVAVGSWGFDQHTESRRAVQDPANASRWVTVNEGYMRKAMSPGPWYDVPFAVMLPARGQGDNLAVSVAISATSIAYASARIEQMFVDLGAAAGVAAALALEAAGAGGSGGGSGGGGDGAPCAGLGHALQDTNVTAVQEVLVGVYGQRIHGPSP
jgi:hypothetical protein